MTEQFLSVSDVAARLQLHRNTVYALIRDQRLPAIKVGITYRISTEAFSAFVSNSSTLSTKEEPVSI